MRGKVAAAVAEGVEPGITPAYAGKRSGNHVDQVGNRDHPRLCGEKWTAFVQPLYFWGSPPPMRGKVNEKENA